MNRTPLGRSGVACRGGSGAACADQIHQRRLLRCCAKRCRRLFAALDPTRLARLQGIGSPEVCPPFHEANGPSNSGRCRCVSGIGIRLWEMGGPADAGLVGREGANGGRIPIAARWRRLHTQGGDRDGLPVEASRRFADPLRRPDRLVSHPTDFRTIAVA
jgi:hypothetical protein